MYTWGANDSGQLGYEKETRGKANADPAPVLDLEGRKVVQVACGYAHTLALTADGGVYAWGCNRYGQLGHPNVGGTVSRPFAIPHFDGSDDRRVVQIAAGSRFSAALTKGE